MDGTPALFLWELVVVVLHSSKNEPIQGDLLRDEVQRKHTNIQTKKHSNRDDLGLFNVDQVTTNAKLSHFGFVFIFFEDNEAVIMMIIKGSMPTMRHVSRTHRVALNRLFDSQCGPKIEITCVDTKNQLADTLTKGNFTRDEWNHLLRSSYLIDVLSCSHSSPLHNPKNHVLEADEKNLKKRNVWLGNQNQ